MNHERAPDGRLEGGASAPPWPREAPPSNACGSDSELSPQSSSLSPAVLSRRTFLATSAGGVLLLSFGALLPAGCTRYPSPRSQLRFFTAKEYAVLNLLAARILGIASLAEGGGGGGVDVAARLDPVVVTWDADLKRQLRFALRVVEHGTYLFDLKRKRFSKLTPAEQDRYLAGWAASTLGARRVAFLGMKALVSLGYYGGDWEGLGYPGPWLGRVEVKPRLEPQALVPAAALARWNK